MKKFTKMELLLFCFSVCLIKVFHFAEADGIFFGSDTNVFQKFSFCFMAGEFHYCKQVYSIQIHECSTCTTGGVCGDEGVLWDNFCHSFSSFYGGVFYFLCDFCP